MGKTIAVLACILALQVSLAQEGKSRGVTTTPITQEKSNSKKIATILKIPKSTTAASSTVGPGKFNADYPNFYTYWDNKYWPMEVTNIQYIPSSTLTVPTNNKRISVEVTGRTAIPGQEFISTGPPVYETSDLKFYEQLFRESKDYIIIFNFNGRGHMMYYHKSLVPDDFK